MKNSFIIMLLLLCEIPSHSQKIEFFNIGWQDAPMNNLIIMITPIKNPPVE